MVAIIYWIIKRFNTLADLEQKAGDDIIEP